MWGRKCSFAIVIFCALRSKLNNGSDNFTGPRITFLLMDKKVMLSSVRTSNFKLRRRTFFFSATRKVYFNRLFHVYRIHTLDLCSWKRDKTAYWQNIIEQFEHYKESGMKEQLKLFCASIRSLLHQRLWKKESWYSSGNSAFILAPDIKFIIR